MASADDVLKRNIQTDGGDAGYTTPAGRMTIPGQPAPIRLYPYQWLWDTFFCAAEMSDFDQAMRDMRIFLHSQLPNGFLGHIRYNREAKKYFPPPDIYYRGRIPESGELISRITQPPNVAYGVARLVERMQKQGMDREALAFLRDVYPSVFRYHEYLHDRRTAPNGLMVTIHPWENGDDNAPKWKYVYDGFAKNASVKRCMAGWLAHAAPEEARLPFAVQINHVVSDWLSGMGIVYERMDIKLIDPAQRPIASDYDAYLFLLHLYAEWEWDEHMILRDSPFRVCDPLMNSVLLRSDQCLLDMARRLGMRQDEARIGQWIDTVRSGMDALWDDRDKFYYALDLESQSLIRIRTVSSYVPLFSHAIPREKAEFLIRDIERLRDFGVTLLPSTDPEEPVFDRSRYWQGPVWVITNALVEDGLAYYGRPDLARRVRQDTLSLLETCQNYRGGFSEYFDPYHVDTSGMGCYGSPEQSWSAAIALKFGRTELENASGT